MTQKTAPDPINPVFTAKQSLRSLLIILIPGFIWLAGYFSRPALSRLLCMEKAPDGVSSVCTESSINAFDRWALHHGSIQSDYLSNVLQNGTAVFAFVIPWFLFRNRALGLNLQLLLVTAWNGAVLEWCRNLVQRPRPMVFDDPLNSGSNPHQYTSFYSGHTSFVALASSFWFLFVWKNTDASLSSHRWVRALCGVATLGITLATGWLRVHGGRHFPSDVIAGALVGFGLSFIICEILPKIKAKN